LIAHPVVNIGEFMAVDYSRIHRLLKILTLIQGGSGWTPLRLSHECGTTERTIYRDLKMLEGAGIPYFFDPEKKSYGVRGDFFMPPVQLTLDESLALAALAEHVGGQEQIPFTQAAAKGIAKIRGQLPVKIRTELEKLEPNVAIHLAAAMAPEAAADVYGLVRAALANRVALRCEYESLGGNNKPGKENGRFLFKPYALFFGQRAWYVVGYHDQRKEIRSLKLNRFASIKLTDERYEIPSTFSLQKHLGNAWRMIRGDKRYEVELVFDAEFAETVADTHWHSTQEFIWQDDGSVLFRCTVDGLDEIIWWILSMGPHCVVKKPRELAERIGSLAAETAEKYRK
jgi:predicted DNA-binding transcriptional regulator YafY